MEIDLQFTEKSAKKQPTLVVVDCNSGSDDWSLSPAYRA